MLKVNEIFYSIQGESTLAGSPCIFVRLTGCNLRCSYCDTTYAFEEGEELHINDILKEIKKFNCKVIEITGGEPLMQAESLDLMRVLADNDYFVMIETNGSKDLSGIDKRVKIIMDIKCPSGGMEMYNNFNNIKMLKDSDEVKFIIADRNDYNWAKSILGKYNLTDLLTVLFSCSFNTITPAELAGWILEDNLKVRLHLQMHKIIWNPEQRGV